MKPSWSGQKVENTKNIFVILFLRSEAAVFLKTKTSFKNHILSTPGWLSLYICIYIHIRTDTGLLDLEGYMRLTQRFVLGSQRLLEGQKDILSWYGPVLLVQSPCFHPSVRFAKVFTRDQPIRARDIEWIEWCLPQGPDWETR